MAQLFSLGGYITPQTKQTTKNKNKIMTPTKFIFPSDNGLLKPLELDFVPNQGDTVFISGVKHTVTRREVWIDHGQVERVDIYLAE
jgi:hypothetical protein